MPAIERRRRHADEIGIRTYLLFTIFAEQAGRICGLQTFYFQTNGIGGAGRDRTDDPLLAKQVLSQLSYGPESESTLNQTFGGPRRTRTSDLTIISRAL